MKPFPANVSATATPKRRIPMRLSLRAKSNLDGYLFISPWLIGFLLLVAYPLLFSFWLSFQDITNLRLMHTTFVGIDNYKDAFVVDVDFGPLILENFGNLAIDLPIIMVFSLGMALLVSQPLFGRTFFRAILFMPVVIGSAFVITELAEQGIGAQTVVRDTGELEDALAVYIGEGGLVPLMTLVNRIVFVLWRSGVQILIFIAGLHSIPQHFYEAARVDGASNWGIFWKITLPLLSPFILVNIIYTIVDSFTEPFNTTLEYIQEKSLTGEFDLHYGAALGMIYFLIIFAILGIVLLWSRRLVYYIGER